MPYTKSNITPGVIPAFNERANFQSKRNMGKYSCCIYFEKSGCCI